MAHAAIDTIADSIRARAPRLASPRGPDGTTTGPVEPRMVEPLMAHLHTVFFDEQGYHGDTENYYNPLNSYLPAVMERRVGLPVTLTLLYKAVGERIGLRIDGIDAPGHFMAGVRSERDGEEHVLLIDPFDRGRLLTRDEALQRVETVTSRSVEDDHGALAAATNARWIERMLHNLLAVFRHENRERDAAAMLELRSLLTEDA
jgi:regulator of sirC expression with transglutaminase-like and TPR domain